MWSARIAVAVVSAVSLLLGVVPAAIAALPDQQGKIAFTSNRDGNSEIYTMNADGSGQTRLTSNAATDILPAWSYDGTKVAFVSDRDGNFEIYAMNADGSGQTRLTNNVATDFSPAWAPDGSKIAFRSQRDGNFEIYTMKPDGSAQTNITNAPARDHDPAFSPDGKRIAFTSTREPVFMTVSTPIYTMAPDGSDVIRLTDPGRSEFDPTFSPDGQRIAFTRNIFRHLKVHTMAADGSGQTNLSTDETYRLRDDSRPTFSPDGQRIAFASNRDGPQQDDFEIYTMAADGTDIIRITNTPIFDNSGPDWQRGPTRIAYKNASQFCKAEQAFWGPQFASRYGGGANAYGKCVSGK